MSIDERVQTHTALHVLKGAARRVIGTRWTASVYVEERHGRLTLNCERQPSEEEIHRIETLANEKIRSNSAIEELKLDRVEAERRWGDEIYDLFPIPANITRLSILHIPEWNVNACKEAHTKSTGEVGRLRVGKPRYRAAKQLLELPFDLVHET